MARDCPHPCEQVKWNMVRSPLLQCQHCGMVMLVSESGDYAPTIAAYAATDPPEATDDGIDLDVDLTKPWCQECGRQLPTDQRHVSASHQRRSEMVTNNQRRRRDESSNG